MIPCEVNLLYLLPLLPRVGTCLSEIQAVNLLVALPSLQTDDNPHFEHFLEKSVRFDCIYSLFFSNIPTFLSADHLTWV